MTSWVLMAMALLTGRADASGVCGTLLAPEGEVLSGEMDVVVDGAPQSYLGAGVTTGDVSGDGVADLIVGVPGSSVGAAGGGAVYIFHGPLVPGDALTAASANAVLYGPAMARAGFSVSVLGDTDGDGIGDMLVGSKSGKAWLVPGFEGSLVVPEALTSLGSAALSSTDAQDRFGEVVAAAGDLNDDGLADFAVGARQGDLGGVDAGAVYVYFGPVSGLLSQSDASAVIVGESAGDQLGTAITPVEDFDGDGVADLAVSAFRAGGGGGAAYVFEGGPGLSGLLAPSDALTTLSGSGSDRAGQSLSAADVDGDGFTDLMIGMPVMGRLQSGGAAIVSGGVAMEGPFSISDVSLVSIDGRYARSRSGSGVALGDFDGDGELDALTGSPKVSAGSLIKNGTTFLHYGPLAPALSVLDADARFVGATNYAQSGDVLAVGDLNRDGVDDLVIGVWRDRSAGLRAGRVVVALGGGRGDSLVTELTVYTDSDGDGYGAAGTEQLVCPDDLAADQVLHADDCDDASGDTYPGAPEDCSDTADKNCDGLFGGTDSDGDGFAACEECDDSDAAIHPDASEVCGDGVDNNCDGAADDASSVDAVDYYADDDGDGFGAGVLLATTCDPLDVPAASVTNGDDCNDGDADVSPDAVEVCDNQDNNCDSVTDEATAADAAVFFVDADGDGYGAASMSSADSTWVTACAQPDGYAANDADCDDGAASVSPAAAEVCDGVDNDCDGLHYPLDGALSVDAAHGAVRGVVARGVLGQTSAFIGDVTGDGRDDFALATTGSPARVDVFPGVSQRVDAVVGDTDLAVATVSLGADRTVSAVSLAGGDLNADGVSDLVVGTVGVGCDGASGSAVWVFPAPSGSLAPTDALLCFSGAAGDLLGASVGAVDVDADGRLDLVMGAPGAAGGAGRVYLVYGGASLLGRAGPAEDLDAAWMGESAGVELGASLAWGDLNGDGHVDLVMGAPGSGSGSEGAVALTYGTETRWTGEQVADSFLDGDRIGTQLGAAVVVPGDVDGDGFEDLVLGSKKNEVSLLRGGSLPRYGRHHVADYRDVLFDGPLFAGAGEVVAAAGDTNGDGLADFLIGAPSEDHADRNEGGVYLVMGRATYADLLSAGEVSLQAHASRPDAARGSTFEGIHYRGVLSGGSLGLGLSGGGDVDGDGLSDMLLAAPEVAAVDGTVKTGIVYVVRGSAYGIDNAATCDDDGDGCPNTSDLTLSTAGLADLDGDLVPLDCDVCVGDNTTLDVDGDGVCADQDPDDGGQEALCGGLGLPEGACDCAGQVEDCQGVCGGAAVVDVCGTCAGDGTSCLGCDGVPNSGLVDDACGECGGDGSSCAGCDGVPNSGLVEDACGECGGDGSTCGPGFDIIVVPPSEGSTATTTWNLLVVMTNTIGDIPETSTPSAAGLQEFYTPAELVDAYFHHPNSTRAFVRDASYGTVDLEATVAGWIHEGDLGLPASAIRENNGTWVQPVCDVLDCSQFDVVVMVARTETGSEAIGWTMGNYLRVDQGEFQVGFNYLVNRSFFPTALNSYSDSIVLPSAAWAHELMHTLGISGHSNSLWCGNPDSETANPRVPAPGLDAVLTEPCWIAGYGEGWNIMGERVWGTHPNFVQKIALGWLSPLDVHSIAEPTGGWAAASGTTYERTIYPISTGDGLVKGISLDLGDDALAVTVNGVLLDTVHIEYRVPVGFDMFLRRLMGDPIPDDRIYLPRFTPYATIDVDGVAIYLSNSEGVYGNNTYLVDTHPDSDFNNGSIKVRGNPGKFADAMLTVGETLSIPELPFEIQVDGLRGDGGIDVTIAVP